MALLTIFVEVVLLLLLILVSISISISIYKGWPEIRKSEIPPSEFCPISGNWVELGTTSLALTSPIKCYWMLQNTSVTAFTISALLRENQQEGKITIKIT